MKIIDCPRRRFLQQSLTLAAGAPLLKWAGANAFAAAVSERPAPAISRELLANAKVAIVPCKEYGATAVAALDKCFDLLGGLGPLVKGKTATIKLNLTGTNFTPFLNRPVGETFMTHPDTAVAVAKALFAAGARRVRFVESTQSTSSLEATLGLADWDVKTLQNLGAVEFENTRNLGKGKSYAHFRVPSGGYMFSNLELNHAYEETDVMVSMAKLKNHITAGVTLSMKNLFGLTPNSLYGDKAGNEDATAGRGPLHNPTKFSKISLTGLKEGVVSSDPTYRVPHIIADVCSARPIHLAVIDGITSMSGGEGPWCANAGPLKVTLPGGVVTGLNPGAHHAVAT